jgi:nucleoid-associated protein YgaU
VIGRGSRYRVEDVYSSDDPARTDHPIAGARPRLVGTADSFDVRREHRVEAHERLDMLAQRYYGDPLLFWLICDANETLFPEDLMVPGRVLRIPRNQR